MRGVWVEVARGSSCQLGERRRGRSEDHQWGQVGPRARPSGAFQLQVRVDLCRQWGHVPSSVLARNNKPGNPCGSLPGSLELLSHCNLESTFQTGPTQPLPGLA